MIGLGALLLVVSPLIFLVPKISHFLKIKESQATSSRNFCQKKKKKKKKKSKKLSHLEEESYEIA
jgi:hypothetical protein